MKYGSSYLATVELMISSCQVLQEKKILFLEKITCRD